MFIFSREVSEKVEDADKTSEQKCDNQQINKVEEEQCNDMRTENNKDSDTQQQCKQTDDTIYEVVVIGHVIILIIFVFYYNFFVFLCRYFPYM